MNTKHTPSPWHYAPEGDNTCIDIPVNGGTQAFSVLGNSEVATVEDYANARLIAAAFDLLEALHGALFFVPLGTKARERADAAIARAKGQA